MLLKLNSDNEVAVHTTAGSNVVPIMFALEDELQGHGIDDDYVAGDKVQVGIPGRGDEVNALIADNETCSIGSVLESDGDGRLHVHVADVGDSTTGSVQAAIVGISLEAKTASDYGSGSESSAGGTNHNPRIRVKIL
jgi:hypothetical protein